MELVYHPLVKQDVLEALQYYKEISPRLADEFEYELRRVIAKAGQSPLSFHVAGRGFRRANLRRFPFHVLYEAAESSIRVMHVRHNKRHPDYNLERK